MDLRPYQQEALEAALASLAAGSNPVLQLATGTGKSLIIAALSEHYRATGKQAWMLTHVQQLVKQNAATFRRYANMEPAIVCAGLKRKDTWGGVTYGTIQSVAGMLDKLPDPDLIIIDEAHRVPHNHGEPTIYENILSRYPESQRVAMTATPWRMDNGVIYGDGDQFWFDTLAYDYNVKHAVADGWLCPLVGLETSVQLDLSDIGIKGDYIQSDAADAQTTAWLRSMAHSLLKLAEIRKHIGVYCPTVKAAEKTAEIIRDITGWTTEVLHAGLSPDERNRVMGNFMSGETRVLCSVDMITTGFDFPALDCIVCLRPTLSSSLWVQIQGRGTRLHPDKKNCLLLDFVGNLIRLGGIDMCETIYRENDYKDEPEEEEAPYSSPYGVKKEREFKPGLNKLTPIDPMTGQEVTDGSLIDVSVHSVTAASIVPKKSGIPVLLVNYTCSTKEGIIIRASDFIDTDVCNPKTVNFFNRRCITRYLPCPPNSVAWMIKSTRIPPVVTVRKKNQYWNVVREHWE
jgi:DNA repair protein RadD